jgi:hypothetical protein
MPIENGGAISEEGRQVGMADAGSARSNQYFAVGERGDVFLEKSEGTRLDKHGGYAFHIDSFHGKRPGAPFPPDVVRPLIPPAGCGGIQCLRPIRNRDHNPFRPPPQCRKAGTGRFPWRT